MRSELRIVFVAALVLLVLAVGTLAAATYRSGLIRVYVEEKQPGGDRVRLIVPAVVVCWGLKLVPEAELREAVADAREWLPAAAIASRELTRYPDASFVEIVSPEERVTIVKRDGALVVDVDSLSETVHISVPLAALAEVAEELEARRARL
ncbi:MAG: hypothetical protein HYY26_04065 [Acidobacteria bacterium]|nr:hypothetical protein [Acidobacteriota bacterium]